MSGVAPAGIVLHADAELSMRNSLRLPGCARWLAEVHAPDALIEWLARPEWRDRPRFVLGGGSNVVIGGDIDALLLHPRFAAKRLTTVGERNGLLEVEAGHDWAELVQWSVAAGWAGLENLALIPGQCGAAPIQNIGAYGVELAQRLAWVEWLDLDRGTVQRSAASDCGFAYRDSVFKRRPAGSLLVIRIALYLERDDGRAALRLDYPGIRDALAAAGIQRPRAVDVHAAVCVLRRRKLPDPAVLPNAGSFFHNPVVGAAQATHLAAGHPGMPVWPQADGRCKLSAAWLIEQCGFKGQRRGAVGVAPGHALVLVHHGGGRGAALLTLADEIVGAVQARFGVQLQREPVAIP